MYFLELFVVLMCFPVYHTSFTIIFACACVCVVYASGVAEESFNVLSRVHTYAASATLLPACLPSHTHIVPAYTLHKFMYIQICQIIKPLHRITYVQFSTYISGCGKNVAFFLFRNDSEQQQKKNIRRRTNINEKNKEATARATVTSLSTKNSNLNDNRDRERERGRPGEQQQQHHACVVCECNLSYT